MSKMSKNPYKLIVYLIIMLRLCSYNKAVAQSVPGDTILNVNYENGQLSSGISGVRGTVAPGADAAYIISPGKSSTKGIAHKVTLGNPDYYSAEAYRSEADAIDNQASLFYPGMERRYEFSVYLKDWAQWDSNNPPYGDNIFQLKVSGGDPVPVRLLTKRNAIAVRYDASGNGIVISDFRPQINKWIEFRIDVKWTLDNTGYFKIYTRYENETAFTLRFEQTNLRTFTGNRLDEGQKGYIKWGVYREAGEDTNGNLITSDNILTRIAYHDDIRIIKLQDPQLLPIKFGYISAFKNGNNIQVNWTTLQETNNHHFEIEASENGIDFKTLLFVNSKNGNSNSVQNYDEIISIENSSTILQLSFFFGFLGFGCCLKTRLKMFPIAIALLCLVFSSCEKISNSFKKKSIYIKIKQVDLDGKSSYSDIVSVVLK